MYRVKLSSGKKEKVTNLNVSDYTFIKNNLYVTAWEYSMYLDDYYMICRAINPKNKKAIPSNIEAQIENKKSNAKGYSVSYKVKGKYVYTYLKTPKGRFKLGKVKLESSYL